MVGLDLEVDGAFGFEHDLDAGVFLEDEGIGRYGVGKEDIGADGASGADDRIAAHDGGSGVDGDAVFEGGVAFLAAEGLATGEGSGDEADALVHFDAATDGGGFSNDGAGAVIDEEVGADGGSGVEVHAGAAVGPFGHDSGDEGYLAQVEFVGEALDGDGFDEGVGDDDFLGAECGGVAVVGGFDIGLEDFADAGDGSDEVGGDLAGERG